MGNVIGNFLLEIKVALECSIFTLIVLKLAGAVNIAWLWILLPFFVVLCIILILILTVIVTKFYKNIKREE